MTESSRKACSVLVGVFTCPQHRAREDILRATWGSMVPDGVHLVYVYGGAEENRLEGDRLYLATPERYEKLPEKTLAFLRFAYDHPDHPRVIKTDDDAYIDLPAVLKNTQKADYGGIFFPASGYRDWHFDKVPTALRQFYEGEFKYPYAAGHCYGLSRKALSLVVATDRSTIPELALPVGYEDVMIGNLLGPHGDDLLLADWSEDERRLHVFHPIEGSLMGRIHRSKLAWLLVATRRQPAILAAFLRRRSLVAYWMWKLFFEAYCLYKGRRYGS